jgi:UDP-N-acetylmuramoylalanine--D-glutamate ligase
MTEAYWGRGEIAVLGLGRSGDAASRLLRRHHAQVYASDVASTPATRAVADALRVAGMDADAGGHDLARIARASLVVTSPGIPPDAPALLAARQANVGVVSEVELALTAMPGVRYVAVTGTNGKSTVTSLVGHLLAALGRKVEVAGNIGRALCEVALEPHRPEWIALEISSYQLHDTPGLAPAVGVLTNLAPDHLDRYPTVEAYYADKALLFRNATSESRWVVNGDDTSVMALAEQIAGFAMRFSANGRLADAFYDRRHDMLILLDEPLMRRTEFPLLGTHNVGNALAAALAVAAVDQAHTSLDARRRIADALRSAHALPHRLEVVGEIDGVLWVNDSKATNVASARVGVDGMTRPTVLLLGGRHKGEPYAGLVPAIRAHCKAVIAFGEAAETIQRDLSADVPVQLVRGSFEDVVARARDLAKPGECVLLSPACSSFDMFSNYEERGRIFSDLARSDGAREKR